MLKILKPFTIISCSILLVACNDDNSKQQTFFQPPTKPIPFNPIESTIDSMQASIATKGATCSGIVQSYLNRIEAFDRKGPNLNSVIAINQEALKEAKDLDNFFQSTGKMKGDLHCVTVLVKDNIDVKGMPTTAGSSALIDNYPSRDAFIIKNIKEHGGIILGKTNLDEFAFGYVGKSTVGGQVKNIYDLEKGPGGSSSGTATAISGNLAMVGIGTDTGGSIRVPSSLQGLVGLRPSLRLVSQDGIVPLAPSQDTAGPICREAIDCAKLTDSLAGFDTSLNSNQRVSFENTSPLLVSSTAYQTLVNKSTTYAPLNSSLVGKHIGLIRGMFPSNDKEEGQLVNKAMNEAITKLRQAGAIVEEVQVSDLPTILGEIGYVDSSGQTYGNFSSLSGFEFKQSITKYLNNSNSKYKSYDDLLNTGQMIPSFANYNRDFNTNGFSQGYTLNTTIRSPYVRSRLEAALNNTTLNGQIQGARFDALAYPSLVGLVGDLGSSPNAGRNNRLSAFSGFPAISIPAATVNSKNFSKYPLNVNIEFIGHEFDEKTLFDIAIPFQKMNPARLAPSNTPALSSSI